MGTAKRPREAAPTRRISVADALFSKGQQRVLGILFGDPTRSFYASEIIARTGAGSGAAQRELARLESAGLVATSRRGNQKHYQANPASPVFSELRGLVLKTSGLADVLRGALAPLASMIDAAFVYGSVAKGEESSASDVDLLIIADHLAYPILFAHLEDATTRLGRAVNPTIYSAAELKKRVRARNSFVIRVLSQPKLWLIGDDDALPAR